MKAFDIIMQLNKALPDFTDRFTDGIGITSITSVGLTATVITATPHNRVTGDSVTISGFDHPTLIDTITRVSGIATVVTSTNHDLTEGFQARVSLQGATQPEFNGEFALMTVPNRRTFTIQVPDSGPTVATGSPQLNESTGLGYNGFHEITVIDPNTFTYALEKSLGSPAINNFGSVEIGYRITGALSLQSCIDIYTEKEFDKSWAYVVNGEVSASKDRDTQSDAIYVFKGNAQYKQELLENFTVYVASTSSETITARPIRDDMEDVSVALFKSLVGAKLPTLVGPNVYYSVVFNSHGMAFYDKSIYVHAFRFQTTATLTCSDIYNENRSVAFRNIDTLQANDLMTKDSQRLIANIDLDDEDLS